MRFHIFCWTELSEFTTLRIPSPLSVPLRCSGWPLLLVRCKQKRPEYSELAGIKSFLLLIVCILSSPRYMKLPCGIANMNFLLAYLIVKEYRDMLSWVSSPCHVSCCSEGTPLHPHTVLIQVSRKPLFLHNHFIASIEGLRKCISWSLQDYICPTRLISSFVATALLVQSQYSILQGLY